MARFMLKPTNQNLGKPTKSMSLFWIVIAVIIVGLLYNFMVSENYKRTNLTTEDLKTCGIDFNSENFNVRDCLTHLVAEDKKEQPILDGLLKGLFESSRDKKTSEDQEGD